MRLKRLFDNQTFSLEANGRINDFFTQTQWLPRLDHYWLGQPLLDDNLTWYEHSSAAYANIGIATKPSTAQLAGMWTLLPWEQDAAGNAISGQGERLVTRQEIDWPLDFAPFKIVPYALGELGHWGEDINGNDIDRACVPNRPAGQHSVLGRRSQHPRPALQPQRPRAQSRLRRPGIVRRRQPQPDSIPALRRAGRRLDRRVPPSIVLQPFGGGLVPNFYHLGPPSFIDPKFDPRFYALRNGMQDGVTSPSSEIADDLTAVRLGMHHRLQTKRGAPGEERIVDWVTFDTNVTCFPDANRDNFGSDVGLADYDLRWHLGDRFRFSPTATPTSSVKDCEPPRSASVDPAADRQLLHRLPRDRRLFEADVVTATVNYRMSPKWIGSATPARLRPRRQHRPAVSFTRIGESLLTTVGETSTNPRAASAFTSSLSPGSCPQTPDHPPKPASKSHPPARRPRISGLTAFRCPEFARLLSALHAIFTCRGHDLACRA